MSRRLADPPVVGEVIPYWFLWHSEHESGEDAGRKLRPCVVIVVLTDDKSETRVAVVPITHAKPSAERSVVEIPPHVKAQLSLSSARSWIMCDEFNEFVWPGFDLGKTPSGKSNFGFLPRGLMAAVRAQAAAAHARGAFKTVSRDG